MNELVFLIYLFPIVFMIHEFEEIIFFKPWIIKNEFLLKKRFPLLAKHIISRFKFLTVPAFTVAVAEEFILFSIITTISLLTEYYYLWIGLFLAFFLHLIIHIIQWIVVRRYIPVIITSLLLMPYCVYTLYVLINNINIELNKIILWGSLMTPLMLINLLFAHKLSEWIDRKIQFSNNNNF